MRLTCDSRYLVFPVSRKAAKANVRFLDGEEIVYDLDIQLNAASPEWEACIDVARFAGTELTVECDTETAPPFRKAGAVPPDGGLYRERYRPGFHFSAARGWTNDPNGLVFDGGNYHLFFQHNPAGTAWGNMHWGHAVSPDLIRWTEWGTALFPDRLGTVFSGSAVIDHGNLAGFGRGAMLLFYTAAGGTSAASKAEGRFTQCLAYSRDGGRTFVKYGGNPLVGEIARYNRDPKVIWHAHSQSAVMALYLEGNEYALLRSPDFLHWEELQRVTVEGETECPDFYPLPLDGDPARVKWVLCGASDRYLIGDFDGRRFAPLGGTGRLHGGSHSYAAQTWSGAPDGRTVRIAWNRFDIPDMPFSRSMTFPCEMTLRTVGGEPRLCAAPVREIDSLVRDARRSGPLSLSPGHPWEIGLDGALWDISLDLGMGDLRIAFFGFEIACSLSRGELSAGGNTASLQGNGAGARLRVLVDRTGAEIFINDGETFLCCGRLMDPGRSRLTLEAEGGEARAGVTVKKLGGIWDGR